jgi:hypothetical protein
LRDENAELNELLGDQEKLADSMQFLLDENERFKRQLQANIPHPFINICKKYLRYTYKIGDAKTIG